MLGRVLNTPLVPVTFRNSHQSCSVKKGVLKNSKNISGKHLRWSLFLIKLQDLRLQHRCFPVSIAKFLRTLFWWISVNDCFCTFGTLFLYFTVKIQHLWLFCVVMPAISYQYSVLHFYIVQWPWFQFLIFQTYIILCFRTYNILRSIFAIFKNFFKLIFSIDKFRYI